MRSVFVLKEVYTHDEGGSALLGLYWRETLARIRVYEESNRWEGRLLWWPCGNGAWTCQILVKDFLTSQRLVRYKLFSRSWTIDAVEPQA
jgi:hypothetical protein